MSRAVLILDAFADAGSAPLGPSELARRLSLPKSSVINICDALVEAGLVRRRDGGLMLGSKLVELGAAYLATVDIVRDFREACLAMDPVRSETVQLAVLGDGLDVIYLDRREGSQPVRLVSDVGRHLPANCTATGKALLATLAAEELEARIERGGVLVGLTPRSITDPSDLRREIKRVGRRGYAIDDEETAEGLVCVAAAVRARGADEPVAAVSITLLKTRTTRKRLASLASSVQEIAGALAREAG